MKKSRCRKVSKTSHLCWMDEIQESCLKIATLAELLECCDPEFLNSTTIAQTGATIVREIGTLRKKLRTPFRCK